MIVVVQWLAFLALPRFVPEARVYGLLGGIFGGGLAVIVWWLFFSRAPWLERVGALVLMPVAVFATSRVVHASIAGGMMGMMLPIFSIPVLCLALVIWAVASRFGSVRLRRALLVVTILIASGLFTIVRTGGISGDGESDFHWRWTQTPEERLLARADDERAKVHGDENGEARYHPHEPRFDNLSSCPLNLSVHSSTLKVDRGGEPIWMLFE